MTELTTHSRSNARAMNDFKPVDIRAGNPDRALPVDHRHWHALGKPSEMLDLNRLQHMLSPGEVHSADWMDVSKLAEKAGRADAAAFNDAYGRDGNGEGVPHEAWEAEFDNFREGAYFKAIDFSEKILSRVTSTEKPVPRLEAAATICGQMRDAYIRGRQALIDASPTAGPGWRR